VVAPACQTYAGRTSMQESVDRILHSNFLANTVSERAGTAGLSYADTLSISAAEDRTSSRDVEGDD
jgi:hypothetical protein